MDLGTDQEADPRTSDTDSTKVEATMAVARSDATAVLLK